MQQRENAPAVGCRLCSRYTAGLIPGAALPCRAWLPTALPPARLQGLQSSCARGQAAGIVPKGQPGEAAKCSQCPLSASGPEHMWQIPEHTGIQLCHLPSSFLAVHTFFLFPYHHKPKALSAIISQNPGHTKSSPQFGQLSCSFCSSGYL